MQIRILLFLLFLSFQALGQTPTVQPIGDVSEFAGSQVCVDAPLVNSGAPGFGPYIQLIVPIGVTFDSAEIFGSSATITNIGTFPPAPGNQLTDTIIDASVTAPEGFQLILIQPPIGSLVDGAPALNLNLCFSIDPTAVIGTPLGVSITPVFELGDTATGNNGPIIGAIVPFNITPILVEFMKANDAPEGERPPGPSWPVTYTLTADIAPNNTLDNVVIADVLPANFVLDVPSIMITGGTNCMSVLPNITIQCDAADGTTSATDLVVTYSGFFSDALDEMVCDSQPQINNATLDADYAAVAIPQEIASNSIQLQHVTIQKGAGPGIVSPGDTVTYTLNLQVTDFGTSDSLILTDVLPDGVTFAAHGSLTVGGAPIAIVPTVTPDLPVNGQTTVVYDVTAVTGNVAPGTAISVVYTSTVDPTYFNGDALLANDPLSNSVVSTFGLTAGASGCTNGSAATVTVQPTTPTKTVITTGPYSPGDTVTYRLTLAIPSGDTQDVVFTDFFPLPVFDATAIDLTFGNDVTNSPADTLGLIPTLITTDGPTNSLRIEWPDVTTGSPQVLSVDVDVSITTDPFADNLNLTNLLQIDSANSPGTTTTGVVPVSIQVRAPELVITKGVLAADQGTIAPLPAVLPVNGDVTGIDANDDITYQITVENTGGAQAFDVLITDAAVAGITGCVIDSVTDGTGAGFTFTGDLLTGISLTNPLAGNDENPVGGGAPFSDDTALVNVTCQVAADAEFNSTVTNLATVTYASAVAATPFPVESDEAELTTSSPTINKTILQVLPNVDGVDSTITVGETIQYQVEITLPEGQGNNAQLIDLLDNGLVFQSFDSVVAAADVTSSVGFPTVLANATALGTRNGLFDFGTINNNNNDNAIPQTITVTYTVLVDDVAAIISGVNRNNRADFNTDTTTVRDSAPNRTVTEPNLVVNKTTVPTTADAGDTISYNIVVSNTGNSPAFDVDLEDLLADANLSLVAGTVITTQGTVTTGNTGGDTTVVIDIGTINNGSAVTVTFDAVLGNSVVSGETVDNTATVTNYSSLPGGGRVYPNVEDDASVIINVAETTKTVLGATSTEQSGGIDPIGDGSLVDLTIGEEVTFRITSTLAEGVSPSVIITDNLPNNAAGQMAYVSSNVVFVGLNLTADIPMPAADITLPSYVSYDFGQVINATDGVTTVDDQIIIEVTARVTNLLVNSGIETLTNNVLVQFNTGLSTSASANIEVVEPRMSIDKTSATSSADAGDVITFIVSVDNLLANNSSANAFDVVLTDALPAGLTFNGNLNTDSGLAPDSLTEAGNIITATWASYPLGSDTVISFDVTVDNTVNPQQVIQNTAAIDWTSMPGANADERPGNDSDPHNITVSMAGLAKVVTATSEPSTGITFNGIEDDLTIGEEVTYQFTVTLPEGTTPNAVAFDQLPLAGQVLSVKSSRIFSIGGQLSLGMGALNDPGIATDNNADTFNDRVEWILGNVLNTPDGATNAADEVVFEVVAVVNDLTINQAGANDVINQAGLTFTGGNILSTAIVDFVEPELNISKEIISGTSIADAGDTLTYRLTVDHTTASTADGFNLLITDSLPVPGTNWVADGTVTSTCGATVDSSGEPDIEFNVAQLTLASGSCVIEYDVTVDVGVMPNSSYTNQAALQYDSTPVFVAGETRRYANLATATFNTTVPALIKIVTNSSLSATGDAQGDPLLSDLAIGELVDYQITVTFPEGTTENAVIQDNLPLPVSGGSMELISGTVTSIGNMVTTLPGTAVISNTNADAYDDQVLFDFGTVTNPPDGMITADDEIILTITARITDENINAAIEEYINNVTFSYGINEMLMDTATVELVEPNLGLTKSMGSPVNGVVPIQLTLTNTGGTAAAYDLTLVDVIDGNVWDLASIAPTNIPPGFEFTVTPGPGASESTVTINSAPAASPPASSIEPNEVLVFEFDVAIRDDIALPSSIDNTATLTEASSIPGGDPAERDYSDIIAMDTLQLAALDAIKSDALQVDNGTLGEANPDDIIRYTIVIENSGTADATSVVFSDAPDVNTTLVVGSVTSTQGLVVTGNTAADGAVLIDIGTVPPMTTITITFDVVINNPFPQGVTEISNQGLLESNEFTPENTDDPDTGPDDDPTITPVGAGHDLFIEKDDGGITAMAGDTVVYTINYANLGNQNSTGVVITETVPNTSVFNATNSTAGWSCANGAPSGTPCTFTVGDLDGGDSGSVLFAIDVFDPKPAGVTEILNNVSIADDGTNGPDDDDTNNNDDDNTPIDAAPDLSLIKTSNGLDTAPGGTIIYTLTYQNIGSQGATGVVITDAVPANTTFNSAGSTLGWSCIDGDPAGTVCTFNVAGTVAADDPAVAIQFAVTVDNPLAAGVTQVSNVASITDDNNNGADTDTGNNEDDEDTNIVAVPDLTISKTDGGIASGPGQTVVYTISYDNIGDQNATGVVITETVPANTTFDVGMSTVGWGCLPDGNAGSVCTFTVGNLNVGGGGAIDYAIIIDDPLPTNVKVIVNAVSIADDGTNGMDSNPADNTGGDNTPVGAAPDLIITKDDGGITATAGSTITYAINYANIGNQQSTGIVITETVPLHTAFNAAASIAGWLCTPDNTAGSICTLAVGTLNGGGDSGTASFAVDVIDPVPAGVDSILNNISIADDGDNGPDADPNNNNNNDNTPVDAAPDLSVSKVDRSDFVSAGGTVTYDISYANVGTQDATGVLITETVPVNTTFVAASSSAGWLCAPDANAGSTCTFSVGNLAAGDPSSVIQFAVELDNPLPAGFDTVTNNILIADDGTNGPDPDNDNNVDDETTNVGAFPDLSITKTDGGVTSGPGQTIVYTLDYANEGDQNSTGVVITETVPANTTHNPAASSVVWVCTPDNSAGSVCEYSVGALNAGDSGSITFAIDVDDPLATGVNLVVNNVSIGDDGTNGPDSDPDNNGDTDDTSLQLEPPVGLKIGEFDADNPRLIHWTIWWFNPNNDRDLPIFVFDDIPNGTIFYNGESCVADGTSTCTTPIYNAALDRIELTAVLGEDEGAPANSLPDDLNNEIVIRFDTFVVNNSIQRFENQAEANWDEDNDGDPENDATDGQSPIPTDDPVTAQVGDPTVLGRTFSIPTLSWWSLLLMMVTIFIGKSYAVKRK